MGNLFFAMWMIMLIPVQLALMVLDLIFNIIMMIVSIIWSIFTINNDK